MTSNAIKVEDINFQFAAQGPLFFENLDFQLEAGKLHQLKGKNGSGKSTLFSLLRGEMTGIYHPGGQLLVNQRRYASDQLPSCQRSLQEQVLLVNQRFDMLIADEFGFQDNLRLACLPKFPSALKKLPVPPRSFPFLERLELDPRMPAHRLSGGQRQILALAMILQKNPSILLLDEPTATLDPANARLVFHFLNELIAEENLTILAICHDEELIQEFRDGKQLVIHQTISKSRTVEMIS